MSTAALQVESTSTALEAQMPASTGTVAAAGEVLTHLVTVGDGGLVFSPANVIAAPGDLVQFQFYPKVRLLPSYCRNLEDKLTSSIGTLRCPIHFRQPLHPDPEHHSKQDGRFLLRLHAHSR
jgi:hypothetical protein